MRKKNIALLVIFMVLIFSEQSFAYKVNHYREEHNIRAEASQRRMQLIPIAKAQTIAARRIGAVRVSFSMIELNNEADEFPGGSDFRPVYKLKCISVNNTYDIAVDAINGRILHFSQY